jgi:hypothetical protein
MNYLPEILWFLTWPVMTYVSYLVISRIVKKYEDKTD